MRRREFLGALGGAAALPFEARTQDRVRRVGVLMNLAPNDPLSTSRILAFGQQLQQLGWTVGSNLQIQTRWAAGDADQIRKYAAELVGLQPDVILAPGSVTVGPLLRATQSIPIIFVHVPDPVGAGIVASMSRPGGNATGFTLYEYGTSAKWLELLKQIMPGATRAAVVRDPDITGGIGQWGAIQTAAPSFGMVVNPVGLRNAREIERDVTAFAHGGNGGLIVTASGLAVVHRDLIVTLAARHKLPTVYFERLFVESGGLISYGPDILDQFRRAAGYVDRILKDEKPADLPVQAPIKYELAINLKTAKALGLAMPQTLLASANEVIE